MEGTKQGLNSTAKKDDWSTVNRILERNGFRTLEINHDAEMKAKVEGTAIIDVLTELLAEVEDKTLKAKEAESNY
jgi:hypothetical protein